MIQAATAKAFFCALFTPCLIGIESATQQGFHKTWHLAQLVAWKDDELAIDCLTSPADGMSWSPNGLDFPLPSSLSLSGCLGSGVAVDPRPLLARGKAAAHNTWTVTHSAGGLCAEDTMLKKAVQPDMKRSGCKIGRSGGGRGWYFDAHPAQNWRCERAAGRLEGQTGP